VVIGAKHLATVSRPHAGGYVRVSLVLAQRHDVPRWFDLVPYGTDRRGLCIDDPNIGKHRTWRIEELRFSLEPI
jgi:hypothetical protein